MKYEKTVFKANWGSVCVKKSSSVAKLKTNLCENKIKPADRSCSNAGSQNPLSHFHRCSTDRCSPERKHTLTNERALPAADVH